MTKAKIVYYKDGEVVKVERGNYSDGSYKARYGMRSLFEYNAGELLFTPEHCDFNRIELYKRNRAGVPRRLVARVERTASVSDNVHRMMDWQVSGGKRDKDGI